MGRFGLLASAWFTLALPVSAQTVQRQLAASPDSFVSHHPAHDSLVRPLLLALGRCARTDLGRATQSRRYLVALGDSLAAYTGAALDVADCANAEGDQTVFLYRRAGQWHRGATYWGRIALAIPGAHGLDIVLRRDGCCGDPYFGFERVRLQTPPDSFDVIGNGLTTLYDVKHPVALNEPGTSVVVASSVLPVRTEPIVDDTSDALALLDVSGNAFAKAARGSTGSCLAYQMAGHTWCLLLLNPPATWFAGMDSLTASLRRARVLGWVPMSALTPHR